MPSNLSILVITWNQCEAVLRCLRELIGHQQAPGMEIWLYDNASTDNTSEIVKHSFPQVNVVSGKRNLGYAKAANLLVRYARGRACLLLNPDAEIKPDAIQRLSRYLKDHPKVGIVGPSLQDRDGRWQSSGGIFPSPGSILREALFFDRFSPSVNPFSRTVDWLAGTVMLFSRELGLQLGPFDEQFYLYFEDVDLCRRVWDAGWEVHYLPESVATHEEQAGRWFSSRYFSSAKIAAYTRSEIQYFRKWLPGAEGWIRGVILMRSLVRGMVWGFLGLLALGGPWKMVGERVKGYWISAAMALKG